MILTDEQIDYIATNLQFYGVSQGELKDDLLDHICTYIETGQFNDFETAYKAALQQFGGHHAFSSIQRETFMEVHLKNYLKRKKVTYIAVFVTVLLFISGAVFKIFHWPGAMILLFFSFISLALFLLPVYLVQRYKNAERKFTSNH
ncbi:hypothetical protein [Flavobacterium coralii]|uniref:hypothetical protein n=1 Tax=Flavobacterium coralii TaxID=2838017 RepID=UPI0026B4A0B9|tara:strand:+ start:77 stop:514 length:438 start_codon:yes stop_codon:yes gene_type:complete